MTDFVRFAQDLVLGGTSGVIAKTACAPLERIKIILQVQSANVGGTKVSIPESKLFEQSLSLQAAQSGETHQISILIKLSKNHSMRELWTLQLEYPRSKVFCHYGIDLLLLVPLVSFQSFSDSRNPLLVSGGETSRIACGTFQLRQ